VAGHHRAKVHCWRGQAGVPGRIAATCRFHLLIRCWSGLGGPAELHDPALFAAVDEIEKQLLPDDDPGVVHPFSIEDMAATVGLADSVQRDLPCVTPTTAADFLGDWALSRPT